MTSLDSSCQPRLIWRPTWAALAAGRWWPIFGVLATCGRAAQSPTSSPISRGWLHVNYQRESFGGELCAWHVKCCLNTV